MEIVKVCRPENQKVIFFQCDLSLECCISIEGNETTNTLHSLFYSQTTVMYVNSRRTVLTFFWLYSYHASFLFKNHNIIISSFGLLISVLSAIPVIESRISFLPSHCMRFLMIIVSHCHFSLLTQNMFALIYTFNITVSDNK